MVQKAKFIDVSKTFVPVDPNAFPETLHIGAQDSSPEQPTPVMAYKGYNFLPTSYGYKSYFGTNSSLGIDALTARVDTLLVFQNALYENVLIALCDSGIWKKAGETAGAWTQIYAVTPDADLTVHKEWTYTIIADILYCYQQGGPSFQKLESALSGGVTITSIVPTFLNMPAQVGIFRAAGRLAFWDSADSVSWSNLDNYGDFAPSLETLAGYATFTDVQGRIVTIQAHGAGFMVYATKSVVYLAQSSDISFQWKPYVILTNAGISYPRQVAIASPDTLHFAYTSEGLKKIEMAKQETIVPEVTDFLQGYEFPVYLKVLQGRYLFLEILDPEYITGKAQLSIEEVPADTYNFPGSQVDFPDSLIEGGPSLCYTFNGIDNGKFTEGQPVVGDKKPGTFLKPVWTAYISMNGARDSEIAWVNTPCPTVSLTGVEIPMGPGDAGLYSKVSTTSANKKAVTGPEAYVDGIWTMERFIAVQSAIWNAEKEVVTAYIDKILAKATSSAIQTEGRGTPPADVINSIEDCFLGKFISGYSDPFFGYSSCKFWLGRYITGTVDIYRRKITNSISVVGTPIWTGVTGNQYEEGATQYAAALAAANAELAEANSINYLGYNQYTLTGLTLGNVQSFTYYYTAVLIAPPNTIYYGQNGGISAQVATYSTSSSMNAYNRGVFNSEVLGLEQAYCELTGWNYTDENDQPAFVAAAGACTAPDSFDSRSTGGVIGTLGLPIASEDGSVCGTPYEPITIDGITINWPSTSVTLPPSSFLMQKGSIAPIYPTMSGALVYDLHLKKWGKMKLDYKQLIDYSPINSTASGNVPSSTFGILAGALQLTGKISLFDQFPTDSYISYGKVGYYRLGKTSPEEATVHFRTPSTGSMRIETSLGGQALSAGFSKAEAFTNATVASVQGGYPGAWSNIEIRGNYDINYLEYRGFTQGRR